MKLFLEKEAKDNNLEKFRIPLMKRIQIKQQQQDTLPMLTMLATLYALFNLILKHNPVK